MVLATVGTTSHVGAKLPAITLAKGGMYLSGEAEGIIDLKFGPFTAVANGGCVETSILVCSQQ